MLKKLGWNSFFGEGFRKYATGHEAGRISSVNKTGCKVHKIDDEVLARISGRLQQDGLSPAVGVFVTLRASDVINSMVKLAIHNSKATSPLSDITELTRH